MIWLRIVLIFILSVPLFASAANLVFDGISKKTLQQLNLKSEKQKTTSQNIDNILKKLFLTGNFENVIAIQKGSTIIIKAIPIKQIRTINIVGNNTYSDEELLNAFAVSEGSPLVVNKMVEGAENLKEFYGVRGYLNTIITIDPKVKDNFVDLTIKIKESKACTMQKIEFITPNLSLREALRKISENYVGKNFTEDNVLNLEKDIKNFFNSDRYLNTGLSSPRVEYQKNKTTANLRYIISHPYSFTFFIEGESFLSSTEILSKLNLGERSQFSSNPSVEIAKDIEEIYRELGFHHVKVETNTKTSPATFSKKLFFNITEGPRVRLGKIQIQGKFSRKEKFYYRFIRDNSNSILTKGYYSQEGIKEGEKQLIIKLQNEGFLQSRVISTQTTFTNEDQVAEVTILMDEGALTHINKIYFKGIENFSKTQLTDVIELSEGQPLRLTLLEESAQKLESFYRQKGYLDVEVSRESSKIIEYNKDYTKANLHFDITEGPKIVVGSIAIEGNKKTHDEVILMDLNFDIGDILTPTKIFDSEFQLQKTGLFSSVSITTLEQGTQISARTIVIKVRERDPGLFNFGLGVSTEFDLTVRGYLGIAYRNLAGTARAISGRIEVKKVTDIGFVDHRAIISYMEPFLFGKRTRGRVNVVNSRELLSRVDDAEALSSNKVQLLLEKDFTRHLKLIWNLWSFSRNRTYSYPDNITDELLNIAALGPTIELDYRDNPLVTHSGTVTRFSAEYADPLFGSTNTVQYLRLNSEFNWYTPTLMDVIWANSLQGGYIKNIPNDHNSQVPDIKRFNLGGRDTVRGFQPQEITGLKDDDFNIQRDSYFYLAKTELRIPLVKNFGTVLFYDGGAISVSGPEGLIADKYRDSAGIGLRYETPAGPFRIEYGRKLDRKAGEESGRYHISFGVF